MKRSNKKRRRLLKRITALFFCLGIIFVAAMAIWGLIEISRTFTSPQSIEASIGYEESIISDTIEENTTNSWYLILVNAQNPLPNGFEPILSETENGYKVDTRIKAHLENMLSDARKAGLIPKITTAFRTAEEQKRLFEEKRNEYINEGYNNSVASVMAQKWVALPNTSEHQTGLAVDISTSNWDEQNAYTIWEWLENNCYKYGFILRYPADKEAITGISNEPWHFRYVGVDAATEIMNSKLCLEEYLE